MRDGWQKVKLGDVLTRSTARLGRTDAEPTILTCTEGHGLVDQLEHLGRRAASEDVSTYKVVQPYDIVYNVYLLWLGAIGQNLTGAQGITSPVYEVFRPSPELEPRFLDHVLRSPQSIEAYGAISIGTVPRRRRAPWEDFLALEIDLPPLAEQRRIVDLIGALDETISEARDGSSRAGELLAAFRDGTAPWQRKRLGDLAKMRSGPSWKSEDEFTQPANGRTPVLGITNTPASGDLELSSIRYVEGIPASAMRLSEYSSVMIRTNGNRDRIGNVYRADDRVEGYAVSAFQIAIEPNDPEDADLLFELLSAPSFQRSASEAASGTTGLGNVAIGWLKEVRVPWPGTGDRAGFLEVCQAMGEVARGCREREGMLVALRAELLTSLLSGAHEIPESYDETMHPVLAGAMA